MYKWNGGLIGTRVNPNSLEAPGIWNLEAQGVYSLAAEWPGAALGAFYAFQYITATGGRIININAENISDITSVISAAINGDAILLQPGEYTADTIVVDSFSSSLFGLNKNILICGNTSDPNSVKLTVNNDAPTAVRDHPIFLSNNTDSCQLAFLTYKRLATTGTNYSNAITRLGTNTTYDGARAFRVYIDSNNGDISWIYDNSNRLGSVYWLYCTFANYPVWDSKYSGRVDVNKVKGCIFQGTTQAQYTDLGDNITNVPIVDQVYDVDTYPAGHLYDVYIEPFEFVG